MFSAVWFGLLAVTLLGFSAITCGALVLGGWRRHRHLIAHDHGGVSMVCASPPFDLVRTPFASGSLNVAAEARDILARMAAEAAGHLVQLEIAVQPDLSIHADRLALHAVLSQLVGNAVHHAAGGRVLLSAIRLRGRVQIAVIDDGIGPDAAVQQAALRNVAQLVALQGGTIKVEAQRGESTTVLVQLPEPASANRTPGEMPQQRPAVRIATASRPEQKAAQPEQEALAEYSWEI